MSKSGLTSSACFVVAFCLVAAITTSAQTLTTLYTFDFYHGRRPGSPLVQGLNGNFFGTTILGGNTDTGTVFEITPSGTLTSLYSFCPMDNCSGGESPNNALILGVNGDYYGITQWGGAHSDSYYCPFGCGTVFKITPDGSVTTLYNFCALQSCTDGYLPSGLVQGADGNLYGTTQSGGANTLACQVKSFLCGTVFKMTPRGILTTLYSFCSQDNCADGGAPQPGLIQASNGNFYGTTLSGSPGGVVFEITPAGKFSILYTFSYFAAYPTGLTQAANGDLYGTTAFAGAYHGGSIFRITLNGKFSSLYSFCRQSGCLDGMDPSTGLVQGTDGNIYGTATQGGLYTDSNCPTGCGTIFSLNPQGRFTSLYNFCSQTNCPDGYNPELGLIQGSDGKFYGTTTITDGTVFSFDMGLGPYIEAQTGFGNIGRPIGILGNNLSSTTAVSFNGIPASFQVLSDTLVKATVPAGATTGMIELTNSGGTLSTRVPFIVR